MKKPVFCFFAFLYFLCLFSSSGITLATAAGAQNLLGSKSRQPVIDVSRGYPLVSGASDQERLFIWHKAQKTIIGMTLDRIRKILGPGYLTQKADCLVYQLTQGTGGKGKPRGAVRILSIELSAGRAVGFHIESAHWVNK